MTSIVMPFEKTSWLPVCGAGPGSRSGGGRSSILVCPRHGIRGCRASSGLGPAHDGFCRWDSRARPHGGARRPSAGPARRGGPRGPRSLAYRYSDCEPHTRLVVLPIPRRVMPSFIHSSTGATQAHPGPAVLPHDPTCRPSRVALVGAYGYGASHLRRIGELVEQGVAELCAVADPRPPSTGCSIAGPTVVLVPRRAARERSGRLTSSSSARHFQPTSRWRRKHFGRL